MTVSPLVGDVMSKNIPLVAGDQSLRKAAEVMLNTRLLGVITTDIDRRPEYVLTYRRLVKLVAEGVDLDEQIVKYAVRKPVTIRETDTVIEALEAMRRENVRFMSVVNNRGEIVGVVEPRHIAGTVWDMLSYGIARIEGVLRRTVVLREDATLRTAARAMNDNGVPEIYVRSRQGVLRVLREWDFLEAIVRGDVDRDKIVDYAKTTIVKVPSGYDAKAAVELMEHNNILRLLVEENGKLRVVTLTDMAFEALKYLEELGAKTTAFILVKAEPGRESELAASLLMIPEIKEIYTVAGEYDLLIRAEAPSLRELYTVVSERIRKDPRIRETTTLVGAEIAEKR